MVIQLSTNNIFQYLQEQGFRLATPLTADQIEIKDAKNFNLLLKFSENNQWLVKQERFNPGGKFAGEFVTEWQMQAFVQEFSELNDLQSILPEILHFDRENSILIGRYLTDYQDVMEFYGREKRFPESIATNIGRALAQIHRLTCQRPEYEGFLTSSTIEAGSSSNLEWSSNLSHITPEIFGQVPADGLKFYALYQRYDSLNQAITVLLQSFQPCCLTHNDLKLNNILLHLQTLQGKLESSSNNPIRLIDWERSSWGDPAFDLGTVIASYLQLWLSGLVISPEMALEESLQMATIPLEQLQPSIVAFIQAYHQQFPELWDYMPNLLERIIQFAGLVLIQQIQSMLQYQKTFGNNGICMLQVAKSLLCRPQRSFTTVFGLTETELLSPVLIN